MKLDSDLESFWDAAARNVAARERMPHGEKFDQLSKQFPLLTAALLSLERSNDHVSFTVKRVNDMIDHPLVRVNGLRSDAYLEINACTSDATVALMWRANPHVCASGIAHYVGRGAEAKGVQKLYEIAIETGKIATPRFTSVQQLSAHSSKRTHE